MITTSIPVLETDRLRLRAHEPDDLETMQHMWSDPTFVRYVGAQVSDRSESWGRMLKMNGLWSLAGFGYWAVEERATGRYIAQTGFADFKR
ncbi:MAG: GNAT family N-acetyltransferase, partial [Pseudomonadota bacterium]